MSYVHVIINNCNAETLENTVRKSFTQRHFMKRRNIYDSENFSQFKQNQSMAADANAKQR